MKRTFSSGATYNKWYMNNKLINQSNFFYIMNNTLSEYFIFSLVILTCLIKVHPVWRHRSITSLLESALIAYSFEVIPLFAKLAKVKMTTTKVCTILNGIFKTKSEVNLQRGFKCFQTRKMGYFEIDTGVAGVILKSTQG